MASQLLRYQGPASKRAGAATRMAATAAWSVPAAAGEDSERGVLRALQKITATAGATNSGKVIFINSPSPHKTPRLKAHRWHPVLSHLASASRELTTSAVSQYSTRNRRERPRSKGEKSAKNTASSDTLSPKNSRVKR